MTSSLFIASLWLATFISNFGQTVLTKTDFICIGKVTHVLNKHIEISQFEIIGFEWIRENYIPPELNEVITIMGNNLGLEVEGEYLVFLKQLKAKNSFKVIGKISKSGDVSFREKYENIRQLVYLEELLDKEEKRNLIKQLFLKNLGDGDHWLRTNAYGEISILVQKYPKMFEQRDVDQIIKAYFRAQSSEDLSFKQNLKSILKFLKHHNPHLDIVLSLKKLNKKEGKKNSFKNLSEDEQIQWIRDRIQILRKIILFPREEEDRRRAWHELYSFPIQILEPFLRELLTSENSTILIKVTDWLSKRGTIQSEAVLLDFIESAEGRARANAFRALGRFKTQAAISILKQNLNPVDKHCDSYLTALALYQTKQTKNILLDFRDRVATQIDGDYWIQKINYLLSSQFEESQQRNEEQRRLLEAKIYEKWFPSSKKANRKKSEIAPKKQPIDTPKK